MEMWQRIRNDLAWEQALLRENRLTEAERMAKLSALIEMEQMHYPRGTVYVN